MLFLLPVAELRVIRSGGVIGEVSVPFVLEQDGRAGQRKISVINVMATRNKKKCSIQICPWAPTLGILVFAENQNFGVSKAYSYCAFASVNMLILNR